ncbi:hypothetical protein SPRG_13731 [Saprolegnia parasitica CBS 223.65]|uniref:Uncharacterized protein n=1 Tax=Saprolegnia parasitica (strain CBS 223.65) TaxID=695850 RepID=A0A067C371_SAPPC|nr:hypothetical protein SPRG_13731 [Saprolegnia parasitica CBS 223.65]KDO21232.1 hypothetical protein SPRG_13731 [Saprolegnia parasitica CBS 223.65]|eukprot:XP_012208064.1 hypothetical protein SPRG_13731 [Saprolegnia parasitica CBS 223.65]
MHSGGGEKRKTGRRVRRPSGGATNLHTRDRWKYLSTKDELPVAPQLVHGKDARAKAANDAKAALAAKRSAVVATDIDGDGIIDVREMRMAKYLHEITSTLEHTGEAPTEAERNAMRVAVGKYTIAHEFIDRNNGKLWRYGTVFAGKSNDEAVRCIAEHKNFAKLMPYLETVERQRTIRSSQHLRSCLGEPSALEAALPRHSSNSNDDDDDNGPQTWVYTQRKLRTPTQLQARAALQAGSSNLGRSAVVTNDYGAIDIDGDGVIDDYEMQLHVQLKQSTLHDLAASDLNGDGVIDAGERVAMQAKLQAEGRLLMAREFVGRNAGDMWKFNGAYKGKSDDQIAHLLANDKGLFSKTMNKLRAKERLFDLKSSKGVTACLVDPKEVAFRVDPANVRTPRHVKSKNELLEAQRQYSKMLNSHETSATKSAVFVKPLPLDSLQKHVLAHQKSKQDKHQLLRAESCPTIGLPQLFASPVKLPTVKDFRITKWKSGATDPPIY